MLDGEERRLAAGLTVRHLLSPEEARGAERGELAIVDARGQERGLGGALLEGMVLSRRRKGGPRRKSTREGDRQ